MRTCIGCRRVAPADELVRVTRQGDGTLALGHQLPGRGAWICAGEPAELPAVPCMEQATRRRAFSRAFRDPVDQAAVLALRERVVERARIQRVAAHPCVRQQKGLT